jgi:hypothetical protein
VDDSKKGSSFLAYFNIVCVVAGTGALGLPYALRQGGWIGKISFIQLQCQSHTHLYSTIGLFILILGWLFSTCKIFYIFSAVKINTIII